MKVSLLFLRIFIASWIIPLTWLVLFPVALVMVGCEEAVGCCEEFIDIAWNGSIKGD